MAPSDLPRPAALLLALLRGDPCDEATLTAADWDAVGVYAHATGLGPLLVHHAGERLPPLLTARLRLVAQRTAWRNQKLLAALATVLDACAQADIPVVVLKGAYLAPAVYGDLALRGMSDLDLWLRPDDLPRFQALMSRLEYTGKHTDPESGPGIVKHEWTFRPAAAGATAAANPYLFGGDAFHIEPHTSLTESWFGLRLDIGPGMWERTRPWQGPAGCARVLDPRDTLLHVAVHAVFHLIMGKPMLLQLFDLRRLLEVFPDGADDELVARARRVDAAGYLLAGLRLARLAYAAPVSTDLLEALAAASPRRQRRQAERLTLAGLWRQIQQAPLTTLRQRLVRGLHDRIVAARWARDRREALRVWGSALAFTRTDTAALLGARLQRLWPRRRRNSPSTSHPVLPES
ncbi:MAG: nucleotidyltransferase family protein [Caldilineales bacterium]|nr:nucleotidyltransferase family protein [Caldilineales bacterium]